MTRAFRRQVGSPSRGGTCWTLGEGERAGRSRRQQQPGGRQSACRTQTGGSRPAQPDRSSAPATLRRPPLPSAPPLLPSPSPLVPCSSLWASWTHAALLLVQVVLNQGRPGPVVLSGWSRADKVRARRLITHRFRWFGPGCFGGTGARGTSPLGVDVPIDETLDPRDGASSAPQLPSACPQVSGHMDGGYALYVDVIFKDGTRLWGYEIPFDVGTHGWQYKSRVLDAEVAIDWLQVTRGGAPAGDATLRSRGGGTRREGWDGRG